jgi:hypothetical protein
MGRAGRELSVHTLPKKPKNGAREARNGHPSSVRVGDDPPESRESHFSVRHSGPLYDNPTFEALFRKWPKMTPRPRPWSQRPRAVSVSLLSAGSPSVNRSSAEALSAGRATRAAWAVSVLTSLRPNKRTLRQHAPQA